MVIVKTVDQPITEDLVESLIGEYVHCPVNIHTIRKAGQDEVVKENAWFGGQVAGYEKAVLKFDYLSGEFLDEPKEFFNILMTDGLGYVLSPDGDVELRIITKEEFIKLVAEEHAKQSLEQEANNVIQLASKERKNKE